MTSTSSGQTHTPPHLKWLLNERAMLCGEVDRRDEAIRRLQGERAAFVERIQSLDTTMAAFEPTLNPGAAGAVRAIAGKYGQRGGLRAFVLAQVAAAGQAGVDTSTLTERARVRFDVDPQLAPNAKSFHDTVLTCLRRLKLRGIVESVPRSKGGPCPQGWRMASGQTFADLLAQQEAFDEQDPDSP